MGVKDLWNILGPVSHKTPLYDIQDKSVAIDLSCWVCEGQAVGEKAASTQPRMYLRTLFFRTCTLLMMNVKPVFVLEGDAPDLKLNAMKQRNDARFRRYRDPVEDSQEKVSRRGGRSRFKGILKQCKQMLDLMGVACIQSDSEAEALCAQLNRDGLVDAVISQDSDVFLYGAQTVYRNLMIKSGTGTVDEYTMPHIRNKLNLDRNKMVAMSVLCGCDYDLAGVHGIGKEIAFKYLSAYQGDALERLRTLRNDKTLQRLEDEKNGCSKCCHTGKLSEHKKSGCLYCGMTKGCNENNSPLAYKNLSDGEKKSVALELSLRRKALQDPTFPNEDTINEYLDSYQKLGVVDSSWKRPEICKFARFCGKMLEWDVDYAFEKILPLYSRWLLITSSFDLEELVPKSILKKRMVKGVPSFDIGWEITDENLREFLTILPDSCSCLVDGQLVTVEPQVLISEKLPELHSDFIDRTTKKKPVARRKKKSVKIDDELSSSLAELKIDKPKARKKTKSKTKPIEEVLNELSLDFSDKLSTVDKFECNDGYNFLENSQIFERDYGNHKKTSVGSYSPDTSFSLQNISMSAPLEDSFSVLKIFSPVKNSLIIPSPSKPSISTNHSKKIVENFVINQTELEKDSPERYLNTEENNKCVYKTLEANFDITFDIPSCSFLDVSSTTLKPQPPSNVSETVSDDKFFPKNSEGDIFNSNDVSYNECNETIMVTDDESTDEYDISAILDDIISRRQYY